MACLTVASVISQLSANKIGILACFIAVFTFAYWLTLARWLAAKLKPLIPRGIYRDAVNSRIKALTVQIKEMKSELDSLSPTAQFAAYFKKERNLKQLLDELSVLTVERDKNSGIASTVLLIFSGIFVQLIAISLMFYSQNVIIGYINSSYFWPFNFLLYIPNFSIPINADDNNNTEETPITLFAFLSLVTFVWHTTYPRTDSSMKWKIL